MQFGELDGIGQAKARTAVLRVTGIFHLLEGPQHALDIGRGDADALVAHARSVTERSEHVERHFDTAPPSWLNLTALETRLSRTCRISLPSARTIT